MTTEQRIRELRIEANRLTLAAQQADSNWEYNQRMIKAARCTDEADELVADLLLKKYRSDAEEESGVDLVMHIEKQRDFSLRTFGPGARTKGIVDHIRKELIEVELAPDDLEEWIDIAMLALDGAWRAGYEPHQIANQLVDKLVKNEARDWPDWRNADPEKAIEHVRS